MGDFSPKIAEALAFCEALSWIKSKGLSNVVFELDSLQVVQASVRKRKDLSYFGDVLEECFHICKDLRSHLIKFVKRSANMAAHRLAREAISMSERIEFSTVPAFLSNVIFQDLDQ